MNSPNTKIDERLNETKKNHHEILLNLFKVNKKRYRVLLDLEKLVWEYDGKIKKNDKNVIHICDIIAVKHSIAKNNFVNCLKKNVNNNSNNINNSTNDTSEENINNYKNPKTNLGYQSDTEEIVNVSKNDKEQYKNLNINLPLSSSSPPATSPSIKSPLSIIQTTSSVPIKTELITDHDLTTHKQINNDDDINENDNEFYNNDNDAKLENINRKKSIQQLSSLLTSTTQTTTTLSTITDEIILNNNNSQYLIINYAKRLKNSKKNYNKWCCKTIIFYNNDTNIIMEWYNLLCKYINEKFKRPKTILLFINPYGGKKNGLKIYEKICKPLFKLANINVICIISQKSKQIYDIIMEQTLKQYDAICCIGGDGTFSELFNGLIYRTMKDLNINIIKPEYIPKPNIPIGIIPGGSTNTIVYCLHGTCDVITSTIHIILGKKRGLDLASVYNKNGLKKFYASVISYGYLGDIALDSENFRWMGPKRYDYSGIKKFLNNRGYKGDITFLSSETQINYKNDNINLCKKLEKNKEIEIKSNTNSSIKSTTKSDNKNSNFNNDINNIMEEQQIYQSNIDNEISTTKCYVNCLKCTNSMASLIESSSSSSSSSSPTENVLPIKEPQPESSKMFKNDDYNNEEININDIKKIPIDYINTTLINNYNLNNDNKLNEIFNNLLFQNNENNDTIITTTTTTTAATTTTVLCDNHINKNNKNYDDNAEYNNENNLKNTDNNDSNNHNKNLIQKQQQKREQLSLSSSIITPATIINQYNKLFLNNVKGNFFLVSGANISCSCDRSPNGWSQYSHLGDGYLDIVLVRHTTFFNNLKLLMAMTKRNGNINNLPFVELYRTKKFLFKAQKNNNESSARTSKWNCDGEVIHDIDLIVSSHCQLIDVFMRGPYPEELDDEEKTIKCCGF